jgi:hypothetical protein
MGWSETGDGAVKVGTLLKLFLMINRWAGRVLVKQTDDTFNAVSLQSQKLTWVLLPQS